ncbi:MAG: hypothetical protein V3S81_05600 [Anaerolineales bacterium]
MLGVEMIPAKVFDPDDDSIVVKIVQLVRINDLLFISEKVPQNPGDDAMMFVMIPGLEGILTDGENYWWCREVSVYPNKLHSPVSYNDKHRATAGISELIVEMCGKAIKAHGF